MQTQLLFTSSFGKNIFLSILFSNALGLRSSIWETGLHTPVQHNRKNDSSVYPNRYIFGQQTGRQKNLHPMIADIHWL